MDRLREELSVGEQNQNCDNFAAYTQAVVIGRYHVFIVHITRNHRGID